MASPNSVTRKAGEPPVPDSPPVPPAYDYERYSRLAGPLTDPDEGSTPYRVAYRGLLAQEPHRIRATLLLCAAPLVSALLLFWLLQPDHWVERPYVSGWESAADTAMLVSIGLIEFFRLCTVFSNAHATLVARDPVPVTPEPGTRVAFLTSFVPGKEPIEMVTRTLEAAVRVRHRGTVHVWLLDEGDDPAARAVCARLGVRHFTRKGVEKWNRPAGPHRARTKHGNYNAWLDAHGGDYDFFASVDTDHVPLPNYLERMLGYFRDPDVAFVIGPQVYGNYDTAVTKAAESQQFLFHALIQRAGNAYGSPMFVGTSNAVRVRAIRGIGGLYDSITEDMATGFELHRARNPETGRKWRSVYTPDVLAVGEGPAAWTDFFTQQLRWSRGTYETILKQFWKAPFSLSPGRLLNYTLLVIYYPMTALNWLLAALSCVLFLVVGASGLHVPAEIWLMLYSDAAALQIGLYIWNRRHNVSPHEPEGSGGLAGMAMSALSAPVYAKSLIDAVLRRKSSFVVTPKGDSASPDRLATFRIHLCWALVFGGSVVAAPFLGHLHAAITAWALLALALCLAPVLVWAAGERRPRGADAARPAVPAARADSPTAEARPEAAPRPAGTDASRRGPERSAGPERSSDAVPAAVPAAVTAASGTSAKAAKAAPAPAAERDTPAEKDPLCAI